MDPPETHPSLIVRLKSRQDQNAWTEFVVLYESFLHWLIRRRGVPATHIPDVTQAIFTAISQSIDRWRDDGCEASFRRWLCGIARNVTLRYLASERKTVSAAGGTDALEILQQQPSDEHHDSLLEKQLDFELVIWAAEKARGEFIETSWQAFWATTVEGREVADVADELALSRGSVYMSRSRIMHRLRTIVAEVTR